MVLTADRKTGERSGNHIYVPVAASTQIYHGGLVAIDSSGNLVPASADATLQVVGMATENVDNSSGSAGDLSCKVKIGFFRWGNSSGGDEIAMDNVGAVCYAVDDETVALTSSGGTRPPAGVIFDVDDTGVWVDHTMSFPGGADGDLVAANNLSDVASAATSRGNLGIIQNMVLDPAVDLVAANAAQIRYVHSGPDATINHIRTVLSDALATGDATLTADIGGVAVTDGVVTIAEAGSAEDDVDVASPSAANVISEGDVLTITIGGANTAAETASVMMEVSY